MQKQIKNWKILKTVKLKDLQVKLTELEHTVTKARYIHLENKDKENVFCVAFRTTPTDDTGAAHILEHSVLAGSRNYPVRDPFFSMLKRSACTFMNAFTSADWTAYPFATRNRKDFFNLLSVYLDAAFYPLLAKETFAQEGIRLEEENGRLVYKGVVYNEMKGSLSSPERIMEEAKLKALFPHSPYRFNSGGVPDAIRRLRLQDLKAFHARYYHPGNAVFYSYGSLPLEQILDFVNKEVMDDFPAGPRLPKPGKEPACSGAGRAVFPFPATDSAKNEKQYQASLAFRTARITDEKEVFAMELLEDILMDSPSSPLRQALFSSGLGSELSDASGLDTDLREAVFSCGLKDISEKDIGQVERIVKDELEKLCRTGLDRQAVESSLNKLQISHREISNAPYPYGLKLWMRLIEAYLWGGGAQQALADPARSAEFRRKLLDGRFLARVIRRFLLDNPCQALVVLKPDAKLRLKQEAAERAELDRQQKAIGSKGIAKVRQLAQELALHQNRKEDLSILPSLELSDIPKRLDRLPSPRIAGSGKRFDYEKASNGIYYFSLALPLAGLDRAELELVPLWTYLLPLLGTRAKDYIGLSKAIDKHSGGIYFSPQVFGGQPKGAPLAFVSGGAKCLDRQVAGMYRIFREILFENDFSDSDALLKFVREYQARLRSGIIEDGSRYAISASQAALSDSLYISELWSGLAQVRFVDELLRGLEKGDSALAALQSRLSGLSGIIARQPNGFFMHAGSKQALSRGRKAAYPGLRPDIRSKSAKQAFHLQKPKNANAGFSAASAVSFVAMGLAAPGRKHPDAAAVSAMSRILSRNFLHQEIREKGGAYGGGLRYNMQEGALGFYSYRDPHILRTLDVFKGAYDYIRSSQYGADEIKEAIIQICSDQEGPHGPAEEAAADFQRRLLGIAHAERQAYRDRVLKLTKKDIERAGKKYLPQNLDAGRIAVISNREKIEAANQRLGSFRLELKEI